MSINENNNTTANDQPGLSQSQLRTLRVLVIMTSVLLVAGFIGLLTVIVYKLTNLDNEKATGPVVSKNTVAEKKAIHINILEGGKVKAVIPGNGQTTVHITGLGSEEMIILNNKSGKIINRFIFKNK